MQERAVRLAMLVMVAMVMGSSPGHAAPSAQRRDPATVDLDALERDVVTEINRIRTDPKEFANVLAGLTSTPMTNARPYDIRLQFPDGEDSGESRAYLNSGIATARGLAPMKPLEWSAGLAKAAGDYAARNPQGHRDFGTTLGGRLAAVGAAQGGSAENIDYGGATGLAVAYRLYIDSGVPDLGHRNTIINPRLTHVGVGCFAVNKYKSVTCVLNYGENWVDKQNMVKLEVGKQYVALEPDGTVRYFKLSELRGDWGRLQLCPDPGKMGSISGSGIAADLMTPAMAAAKGLKATNEPCAEDAAPLGVLNNGSSLPIVAEAEAPKPVAQATATAVPSAAESPATATAVPAAAVAQGGAPDAAAGAKLEVGKQYAVPDKPGTFRYFKLTQLPAQAGGTATLDLCPDARSIGDVYVADILTVAAAQAKGLAATNQPCSEADAPFATSNESAPAPAPVSDAVGLILAVEHQYAMPEGNTFKYIKLVQLRGGGINAWRYDACPNPKPKERALELPSWTNAEATAKLMVIPAAIAKGLKPTNEPCPTDKTPYGRSQ